MDGVNSAETKATITTKKLDARRLLCPLPVIRTQDAVQKLKVDDVLEVTCTDPGAKHDIPSWCRINGHILEKIEESHSSSGYEITLIIRVGSE